MSRMLSLTFHAWTRASTTLRADDSRRRLEQVVAMAALPPEELARAHRMLGGHFFRKGHYSRARNQLRSAIRLNPNCLESVLELARAWEEDPYGCDRTSAVYYRRATKLDANSAIAWACFGRACVRIQHDDLAKRAIRKAIQLAPADAVVLGIVVEALRESGRLKAALRIATRARFRNPKSKPIQELVERVRFEMVRVARRRSGSSANTGGSNVLPFVRVVGSDGRRRTVRLDDATQPAPMSIRLRRNG